jgi:hypothetical protein
MNAFPYVVPPHDGNGCVVAFGMELRDYFAAKAMQGILASDPDDQGHEDNLKAIAVVSYKMADAMMKARDE